MCVKRKFLIQQWCVRLKTTTKQWRVLLAPRLATALISPTKPFIAGCENRPVYIWNDFKCTVPERVPFYRDRVPIGTFLAFWVPIYISGSLLSVFGSGIHCWKFWFFPCLRVKFHKSLFWVPMLAAGGPYWVPISQKMGPYWVPISKLGGPY